MAVRKVVHRHDPTSLFISIVPRMFNKELWITRWSLIATTSYCPLLVTSRAMSCCDRRHAVLLATGGRSCSEAHTDPLGHEREAVARGPSSAAWGKQPEALVALTMGRQSCAGCRWPRLGQVPGPSGGLVTKNARPTSVQ